MEKNNKRSDGLRIGRRLLLAVLSAPLCTLFAWAAPVRRHPRRRRRIVWIGHL
jgi:hypothetical protein